MLLLYIIHMNTLSIDFHFSVSYSTVRPAVVLKRYGRRFVCKVKKMKDILSSIRSTRKRPKYYDEAVAFKEKRTRELPSELRGGTSRFYAYVFVFVDRIRNEYSHKT